jgi:GNAT superfamily N-acetyltransferase
VLYPLSYGGVRFGGTLRQREWWSGRGSNPRPSHCERDALPAELPPHTRARIVAPAFSTATNVRCDGYHGQMTTAIRVRDAVLDDLEFLARGNEAMAQETGTPLGQLMVTYEWSDWRNAQFWWFQSVHVLPEVRRRGVFRALYAHVDALVRASRGVCGLRLYVESDNARAQRTYQRCGMHDASYRVMEVDYSGSIASARKE